MEATDARLLPLLVADIFELAGALRRRGERLAARAGQTQARWQLLSAASGAEPRTVAQLARRLGVARQGVQRLANVLVDDGLAEYATNPNHRTSPALHLTPAGRRALARITTAAEHFHRQVAAELAPGETAALHTGLRQLLAVLHDLPE